MYIHGFNLFFYFLPPCFGYVTGNDFLCRKRIQIMAIDELFERYVNFYTYFGLKKLFGTEANKELLISFLNALLDGKENIKDLTYLNAE